MLRASGSAVRILLCGMVDPDNPASLSTREVESLGTGRGGGVAGPCHRHA